MTLRFVVLLAMCTLCMAGCELKPAPVAETAPPIRAATAEEMFPFPPDTPLLDTVVSLPEKRAPLVYLAFGVNSENQRTSASEFFGEMVKYQLRAQRTTHTLMQLIPNSFMLKGTTLSFEPPLSLVSHQMYLDDATALGADYLVAPVFDGYTTRPSVAIKCTDLRSSRSEVWSSQQAGLTSPHDIIVEASVAAMRFAGYSDDEINAEGVRNGVASDETFDWYCTTSPEEKTFEGLLAQVTKDPAFVYGYGYVSGTTNGLQLIDIGLKRFPDDPRLQLLKGISMADAGSTEPTVRFAAELIRKYPDNLYTYLRLASRVESVFGESRSAKEPPLAYENMLEQVKLLSDYYPESYFLKWDYAFMAKNLAAYIRGTETAEKIPEHSWATYHLLNKEAYNVMGKIAESYPKRADIATALIYFDTNSGASSLADRKAYIKHVATLDPRETEVETEVAFWNSIGYGTEDDYFAIIDDALKSHDGDAQAIREIVISIATQINRQVGWKQMTREEAYKTDNPYVTRFLTGAEFVYSKGLNLGADVDWMYKGIAELRGRQDLLNLWKESGQNSALAFVEAKEAAAASQWERCLKYAQLAIPHLNKDENGHLCHYYKVKSLWKLKRYEESLKAARESIMLFPKQQTFPYMYAVVALEYGKNLETAFDCAWYAVDLGTSNPGCNDTFEKLRVKLNKPNHPALAALKK